MDYFSGTVLDVDTHYWKMDAPERRFDKRSIKPTFVGVYWYTFTFAKYRLILTEKL